ncbi:hypothetical protein KA001_02950 [Patescibacteria group bacterium]|nr:hypothetical protein [Patescibacteria group bacterium]
MPYKLFLPKKKKRSVILSLQALFLVNLLLFSVVCLRVLSLKGHDLNILGFATNVYVSSLLEETNKTRIDNNLKPVTYSPILEKAAEAKAKNMFLLNYWAHVSPSGKTPWQFIKEAGYKYTFAGENLAKDFDTSASVVSAWMDSPTHRENLLNPNYTEIGFAAVNGKLQGEETTLIVQLFGTPSKNTVTRNVAVEKINEPEILANEPEILNTNTTNVEPTTLKNSSNYITVDVVYVKYTIFALIAFFAISLFIDGIVAYRRDYKRLTGGTVSHLFFLVFAVILFIYLSKGGII